MPFSFNPGQQQEQGAPAGGQSSVASTPMNNGVPALVVPTIPTITSTGPVEEKLSPFAFRNRNKSKFGVYFQGVVFLIFGIIVLTIIGLFVYKMILEADVKKKTEELATKQQKFPELELDEMKKFSDRLKMVNKVMKEHTSVKTAFEILEHSIENPAIYTKFTLSKNKSKKGYNVDLLVEVPNYYVAYQQTEILKSKIYSNYINVEPINVSNISLDKNGTVSFKINTSIAIEGITPSLLTFKNVATTTVSTNETPSIGTTTAVGGEVVPSPTVINSTPQ